MDALIDLKHALDYMETQMENRLDIEEVAKAACMSAFHFQRLFHVVTGVTVAEYVRKRKLTLAAQELASSTAKVVDVALKYGYDTPESFSKAFRRIHGLSPSEARTEGAKLKAFPRISFQLILKGDKDMDYRIENKEAFTLVGKSINTTTQNGENHNQITQFWQDVLSDGTFSDLLTIAQEEKSFGACYNLNQATGQFSYLIGVNSSLDAAKENNYQVREIPAATWAVFTSVGPLPHTIQQTFTRVFQEWFPATGYEHAGGSELEVYYPGDTSVDDYRCEIWIPILKKQA
ncbi:effector binding domain-containing protein [Paenibacillus sp. GCM10027627]|uniref:AraC family transcriptional regulator n=1 Tax=unclassified Paenibacillus TaxID=185978 RepID=UPI00363BE2F8